MTFIVDEVMLREPNLLVPGKRPVGPVKIDWNNTVTNGMVFCAINVPGGHFIDLVSGKLSHAYSTATVNEVYGRNGGSSVQGTDGTLMAKGSARGTGELWNANETGVDFLTTIGTLITLGRHEASVGNNQVFYFGSNEKVSSYYGCGVGIDDFVLSGYGRPLIILDGNNANAGPTNDLLGRDPEDMIHFFGVAWDGTNHYFYTGLNNSVLRESEVDARTATSHPSRRTLCSGDANSLRSSSGVISIQSSLNLAWNRVLSKSEYSSLYFDPYQILIPA